MRGSSPRIVSEALIPAINPCAAAGEKSPVIAGILNWLWSGVGNIYLGQKTKGVVFCVITSFLIILDIVTCSLGAIIHVPYMIIMIIDAVLLANRIGRGESIAEWKFF
jgi:TM2 domain-containing membrane protein YozV